MKTLDVKYKGHAIRVENSVSKERLFVDGDLQDEFFGFGFRSRLFGRISDGEGGYEEIRVSLGGWSVQCRIFVDNRLIKVNKVNSVNEVNPVMITNTAGGWRHA